MALLTLVFLHLVWAARLAEAATRCSRSSERRALPQAQVRAPWPVPLQHGTGASYFPPCHLSSLIAHTLRHPAAIRHVEPAYGMPTPIAASCAAPSPRHPAHILAKVHPLMSDLALRPAQAGRLPMPPARHRRHPEATQCRFAHTSRPHAEPSAGASYALALLPHVLAITHVPVLWHACVAAARRHLPRDGVVAHAGRWRPSRPAARHRHRLAQLPTTRPFCACSSTRSGGQDGHIPSK